MRNITRKHKKIVTKPIKIFHNEYIFSILFQSQTYAATFRSSANATSNMYVRNGWMSTRQDKMFQFRQVFIHSINFHFQNGNVLLFEVRNFQFWLFLRITSQ